MQSNGTSALDDVVFDNVSKSYGDFRAVGNLNFSVKQGEFLTFLGPSGSGKTTSLLMLAGFEMPTDGTIYLKGRPLDNVPSHKRNIGMVFQNYALFPHMTVKENIAFPLSVRGLSKPEMQEPIARALELVRLKGLSERRPNQLSGGQQQRVALARALVFNPALILMDEPLGALDRALREEMQIEIKRIHRELGVTLLYVTHDQAEALTMSDRIAVFNHGAIQQIAAPTEMYEAPATAFIAQFIGESNQLPGKILGKHEDGFVVVEVEGGHRITARSAVDPRPGAEVVLSIRPERIGLSRRAPKDGCGVPAVIQSVIYRGDHFNNRFEAAALGPCRLTAKTLSARSLETYQTGDLVTASWSSDDWWAFEPLPGPPTTRNAGS